MLSTGEKKIPPYIPFFALSFIVLIRLFAPQLMQKTSILFGTLTYEWIIIAGTPLLLAKFYKVSFSRIFPLKPIKKKSLLYTLLMTFSLVVLIDYLTFWSEFLFPLPPAIKSALGKLMETGSFGEGIWRWFVICITPAICEEIFFRGFFQNSLSQHWKRRTAFIVTAVAFALLHSILWYWHLYLILGFYLGWLLYKSGNLWLPIIAHLLNNSWTYINHAVGNKVPTGGVWKETDYLVFIVSLIVFFVSARLFSEACVKEE